MGSVLIRVVAAGVVRLAASLELHLSREQVRVVSEKQLVCGGKQSVAPHWITRTEGGGAGDGYQSALHASCPQRLKRPRNNGKVFGRVRCGITFEWMLVGGPQQKSPVKVGKTCGEQ